MDNQINESQPVEIGKAKPVKASKDIMTAESRIVKPAEIPRVRVYLPPLEEDSSGITVDQYEHVTVNGETTLIKRGEYVDIPVPVFTQLRQKFPHI